MDAVKFLKEYKRMCEIGCDHCPMYKCAPNFNFCWDKLKYHPEEAVPIVEKWSKEHPQKTRLQDFLEKYPKAPLSKAGNHPYICCAKLGYTTEALCSNNCTECWNTPID